jgi:hypothetical protein
MEHVVAGPEEGGVVASIAVDEIVAVAAEQSVGAGATEHDVVAGTAQTGGGVEGAGDGHGRRPLNRGPARSGSWSELRTAGIAGCCARAASGQAALAPPSSVMNSRRFRSNTGFPSAVGLPHAHPATIRQQVL